MLSDPKGALAYARRIVDAFKWLYNLDRWRIDLEVGTPNDSEANAEVHFDIDYHKARIVFNQNICPEPSTSRGHKDEFVYIVLHELAHLVLADYELFRRAAMDSVTTKQWMVLTRIERCSAERAAVALPLTWLRASGCKNYIAFAEKIIRRFEKVS